MTPYEVALNQMLDFVNEVGDDYQYLPHPRRWSLPSMQNFNAELYKEAFPAALKLAANEGSGRDAIKILNQDRHALEQIAARSSFAIEQYQINYMLLRHQALRAPVFTVSEPLRQMLADTGVKADIPATFLRPPFRTCYVELEPAEARKERIKAGASTEQYVEGCYLQEHSLPHLLGLDMRDSSLQQMGIDRLKPTRVLDVAFTWFSAPRPGDVDKNYLASHGCVNISLFIQDENQSITHLIKRQLDLYKARHFEREGDLFELNRRFDFVRENIVNLAKTLLYLNLNIKDRIVESPASDFEGRLKAVGAKKRDKLERQAARVYNRIIVGPKSYVPLAERLGEGDLEKGRRRPHFRRGFFSVRWHGPRDDQHPVLHRIPETLVNKDLMVEASHRDYEIR
ncbi:hypothetical protein [Pseudomonas amygdali]|uniref:FRG domain-containing protein n=2 Tax=Pseudomonas amygdali pv. lachrymans TaxID=53707 RepID=A0ABR5KSF2_PSEAV|nr:hypothetical protein [Pseudomonas amygdali]AXH60158.1 hypothetical protein PLA107_033775 [Pseudomonas amygdali pv. lachrymans str. M301315]KPC17560.1 Uncharacterized protein AC499_0762 [Pseudomonas amygdali pv. lachrymans]RMT06174.1 hypothetical protein ALP54_03999 [Pseudomonas amygdali pv. lachrymans]